ncbi:helix-turn-helix domain-containing protein [Solemya velum gill symbiont]|uniref:helix-turn-helix domain-containing protein n=1 Tax=Solemya velum gill symbiont TaxID=2340 RepID=UPI000998E47F|nr:helix-turn-helix domain-containing protein [Solemya velum gill symbiont]
MQNNRTSTTVENLWKLPGDAWLPPTDAAALLGCSVSSLAHWRSQGKGPEYAKRGKLIRYRLDSITTWLEQCATHEGAMQR